ncbi:prepilin peptidase [Lentzea sp. NBRC 105346]|uniref:prepilin peptidase n=1 Tax=Lentzea sp. NBRC 105346 TaxID=3032205 RepID=UPI002556FA2F|nr:prepilin peptidase [Lentzea sp. NBRC 105346]
MLRVAIRRSSILAVECGRLAPPALLEGATGVLFSALAWRVGAEPDLFAYSWLAAAGVQLAALDWKTRTLPTKLIWPSGVVLAALLTLASALDRDVYSLIRAGAGMVALLAFYGTLYFLRPGQLGGGDLRLGGLLGLALGWLNWSAVITGTLLGLVAAAVALLVLRVPRQSDHDGVLPLGPFLIIGALAIVLASPAI